MRFKKLGPYVSALTILGLAGVFVPVLVSVVVALAAVFLSGVIVITADYVVDELSHRETTR